ncbi:MAG: hypothetical protein OEZ47_12700 [Gammaproteobacteria bacterium]|nr:hypothetical protein [Gammaproteobacteria bacterium]
MKFRVSIRKPLIALAMLTLVGSVNADEFVNGFLAAQEHDYVKAAKKWEPLAKEGHAQAQFFMGMLYHSGAHGVINEKEAVKLYHKAAENGNYLAQEYLVVGYQEGWFGLKKDSKKAQFWQAKLDKNNNP